MVGGGRGTGVDQISSFFIGPFFAVLRRRSFGPTAFSLSSWLYLVLPSFFLAINRFICLGEAWP